MTATPFPIADYAAPARGGAPAETVRRPLRAAIYPAELFRKSKAWIEHDHDLVHWFEAPRGGHFAALEQPAIFADDILDFVAKVRVRGFGAVPAAFD